MLLSLRGEFPPAVLALADGTTFLGTSIGIAGSTVGEVVFNTAMTGYQEVLTDPSYCQQIVTLTYPHIGNYGVNTQDAESSKVFAAGLIIRDLAQVASNFRSQMPLEAYLQQEGVVAIANIDTRQLTRHLRSQGAQNGCILALPAGETLHPDHLAKAIALARSAPNMAGLDLAKVVSTKLAQVWAEGEWHLNATVPGKAAGSAPGFSTPVPGRFHVVAYDFGVKRNILRMLVQRGCLVTVVPAQTTAEAALAFKPDGVFFSNGPGDPEPCGYAIAAARDLMATGVPTFGICLGHQIMALASGAKTFKMKFGHHGANHPVKDLTGDPVFGGRVSITSQNHGFAVDAASLPGNVRTTHVSLFDGTLQGIERTDRPAFSFQGHPEASPGPHDISYLFDRFIGLMGKQSQKSVEAAP